MPINTLRTLYGFALTVIEKYTPIKTSEDSLEGIYNRLPIDEKLTTSGQPTEAQFRLIKAAGYQQVINLAPHNAENALDDEGLLLAGLGIPYIHIPVDFRNPTENDFDAFVWAMSHTPQGKIWVHCAANMRVSAFIYRYRREILKVEQSAAEKDLKTIWEPFGVWKVFVSSS